MTGWLSSTESAFALAASVATIGGLILTWQNFRPSSRSALRVTSEGFVDLTDDTEPRGYLLIHIDNRTTKPITIIDAFFGTDKVHDSLTLYDGGDHAPRKPKPLASCVVPPRGRVSGAIWEDLSRAAYYLRERDVSRNRSMDELRAELDRKPEPKRDRQVTITTILGTSSLRLTADDMEDIPFGRETLEDIIG